MGMGFKIILLASVILLALVGTVLLSSYVFFMVEPPALPEEEVKDKATLYYAATDAFGEDGYVDQPMVDKVVIVTGATSGLGASFALNLYKMGATVIVTSRSQEKSDQAVTDIKLDFPFSEGVLHAKVLDVSDFDSIHEFCDWFNEQFQQLHILINNAAINYGTQDMTPSASRPLRSKQGYELLFASNYLGHFLLTDLLLPRLRSTPRAKVLQVSSNAHYLASGADLDTRGGHLMPVAAQVLPQKASAEREVLWKAAYGNSKMAQVMHAMELQKMLDADPSTDLKVFSYSPGLTYTGMIPDRAPPLVKKILHRLFYSPDAALYAPLTALFSSTISGGDEYWNNSPVQDFLANPQSGPQLLHEWLRAVAGEGRGGPVLKGLLYIFLAVHQQVYYGQLTVSPVSPVCLDSALTEGLYRWSLEEVHRHNPQSSQQQPSQTEQEKTVAHEEL
mmetsp:Transcript_12938/g.21136  ORF Transcript_12938/g.21136 Transcript_12938/m.21136 type:complete len:448 (-) Transcript_12938:2467-3810(-)